jgi:ABC-type glucose/galactose transport system permease subunit
VPCRILAGGCSGGAEVRVLQLWERFCNCFIASSVFTALAVVSFVLMGLAFPLWLLWLAWILGSDDFKLGPNPAAAAVAAVPPTL